MKYLVGLLSLVAINCFSQNAPAFTSLCIPDNSVGYSWRNGQWQNAKFKIEERYLAQKLDSVRAKGAILCEKLDTTVYENPILQEKLQNACYLVRRHGREASVTFDSEACTETYDSSGSLKSVSCKSFRFAPNGLFVKLPTEFSLNLESKPKNDYKDSMTLDIGSCSKIE